MSKPHIISDKNKKSLKFKNLLIKKIKLNNFKKENLIIVIGGDGFMLQTLKKNKNSNKHFEWRMQTSMESGLGHEMVYI